jgi:hypothetical protein
MVRLCLKCRSLGLAQNHEHLSKNISTTAPLNCRSLHYAPPDFLLNLVALIHFMRLSLTERRTRGFVQCSVAGNPGTLRSG